MSLLPHVTADDHWGTRFCLDVASLSRHECPGGERHMPPPTTAECFTPPPSVRIGSIWGRQLHAAATAGGCGCDWGWCMAAA
jgi:hypothetical protein